MELMASNAAGSQCAELSSWEEEGRKQIGHADETSLHSKYLKLSFASYPMRYDRLVSSLARDSCCPPAASPELSDLTKAPGIRSIRVGLVTNARCLTYQSGPNISSSVPTQVPYLT
jgi:hypothetical protein